MKKINEGGVSDNSFSIQIIGPECIEYSSNNKIIKIDMGYEPRKRKIYIYASDITRWTSSNNQILISNDEKKCIINNIKEAVKLLTGNFEVV